MVLAAASNEGRAKRAPSRTCIGCRGVASRAEVLRLVRAPDGTAVLDHPPRLGGRGAWIHASPACIERAARKTALSRALGGPTAVDPQVLSSEIRVRLEARVSGLLSSGRGGRIVVLGTEAVREAIASGGVSLLVFATDARGDRDAIEKRASLSNVAVATLLDKARLGLVFGRDELGVLAVTDPGLAEAVRRELSHLRGMNQP